MCTASLLLWDVQIASFLQSTACWLFLSPSLLINCQRSVTKLTTPPKAEKALPTCLMTGRRKKWFCNKQPSCIDWFLSYSKPLKEGQRETKSILCGKVDKKGTFLPQISILALMLRNRSSFVWKWFLKRRRISFLLEVTYSKSCFIISVSKSC